MAVPPRSAHNLLSLHGYRADGYRGASVEATREVRRTLPAEVGTRTLVRTAPGTIREARPNLGAPGCRPGGPRDEAAGRAPDRGVPARLDLGAGREPAGREMLAPVAGRSRGGDLAGPSTTWVGLGPGRCAEGVERVRAGTDLAPPGHAP